MTDIRLEDRAHISDRVIGYATSLIKSTGQWLIEGVKLTTTATLGDTDVYARAAQRYMERLQ